MMKNEGWKKHAKFSNMWIKMNPSCNLVQSENHKVQKIVDGLTKGIDGEAIIRMITSDISSSTNVEKVLQYDKVDSRATFTTRVHKQGRHSYETLEKDIMEAIKKTEEKLTDMHFSPGTSSKEDQARKIISDATNDIGEEWELFVGTLAMRWDIQYEAGTSWEEILELLVTGVME